MASLIHRTPSTTKTLQTWSSGPSFRANIPKWSNSIWLTLHNFNIVIKIGIVKPVWMWESFPAVQIRRGLRKFSLIENSVQNARFVCLSYTQVPPTHECVFVIRAFWSDRIHKVQLPRKMYAPVKRSFEGLVYLPLLMQPLNAHWMNIISHSLVTEVEIFKCGHMWLICSFKFDH